MKITRWALSLVTLALAACSAPPAPVTAKLRSDVIYYHSSEGGRKAAEDVRRIYGGRQAVAVVDQVLPEVQNPLPISQPPPLYPPSPQGQRRKGTVVIDFIVGESGDVVHAAVTASAHPELTDAVLQAVKTWRFTPARRAGEAVRFRVITLLAFDPSA